MSGLFASILLGKDAAPPLSPGAGRVHRLEDKNDMPDQANRFVEIIMAIRDGANTLDKISESLSFVAPRSFILADCEEMSKLGRIIIRREGTVMRCYLQE